jgi:hypothetical protein
MKSKHITASLVVGLAVLAACTERSALTAPSARPLAATASLADRPYTWSLKCSGDGNSEANWSWTAAGVPITGTEVSVVPCLPGQTLSGSGVRPAAADGFSACVNPSLGSPGNCHTWMFDPAGPFKAQLKGTYKSCFPNWTNHGGPCLWYSSTATLNVDS